MQARSLALRPGGRARTAWLIPFVALWCSCESLPGTRTQQSTTIGAATGAVLGAAVAGEGNRLGGALLGAAVGAAGGYLIGARTSWFDDDDATGETLDAIASARRDPATKQDALAVHTADLNQDGFVTLDEIVAMDQAGFDDREMLARLRATDQIFEVNAEQRNALVRAGVSPQVISEMQTINQREKSRVLSRANPD